jgi:hypothetical protein
METMLLLPAPAIVGLLSAPPQPRRNTGTEMLVALQARGVPVRSVTLHRDGTYCADFFSPEVGGVIPPTRTGRYWRAAISELNEFDIQCWHETRARWRDGAPVISAQVLFAKRAAEPVRALPGTAARYQVGDAITIRQRELAVTKLDYHASGWWVMVDISPDQDGSMPRGFREDRIANGTGDY